MLELELELEPRVVEVVLFGQFQAEDDVELRWLRVVDVAGESVVGDDDVSCEADTVGVLDWAPLTAIVESEPDCPVLPRGGDFVVASPLSVAPASVLSDPSELSEPGASLVALASGPAGAVDGLALVLSSSGAVDLTWTSALETAFVERARAEAPLTPVPTVPTATNVSAMALVVPANQSPPSTSVRRTPLWSQPARHPSPKPVLNPR